MISSKQIILEWQLLGFHHQDHGSSIWHSSISGFGKWDGLLILYCGLIKISVCCSALLLAVTSVLWHAAVCVRSTDILNSQMSSSFVTGFEKTWLPHTRYQTYDFTRNELLAQYTIIFHCCSCSKAMSLVSVAAFLRPCVSLEWHFGAIGWSWLSLLVLGGLDKPRKAGQCLLSSIWSAVSTSRTPNQPAYSHFKERMISRLWNIIDLSLLSLSSKRNVTG